MRAHLYINSKGFPVTRHSYSGSESFNYCARKYYLERVQGWGDRVERSSTKFGIALEAAVAFYHQHKMDVTRAVEEFNRLWAEHKDKEYTYSKTDKDWERLSLNGQELIQVYAIKYPTFPYIIADPRNCQVETNFEVFPDTKLAGLEFTSYIDWVGEMKCATKDPIIIDMKTAAKDVPEFTMLDPQLRSYSWVKGWPNVGFLWFRKMGREISSGDKVTMLKECAGFKPGDEVYVLATDDFGIHLTANEQTYKDMGEKFVGKSKAVEALRAAYVKENSQMASTSAVTKQRVQFKHAIIPQESADDIGRAIKRDMIAITQATEKEFFPMQSGVRFPNEKCPNCSMRGICSGNRDLRDALLVRKQMDEFDFGKESE